MNTENGLFKAGFILSLIAVIIDTFVSGIAAIAILSVGLIIVGIMIMAVIALEIYCIVKYKERKGAIVGLLVLGIISSMLSFYQGSLPLFAILLSIGATMSLIGAEEN